MVWAHVQHTLTWISFSVGMVGFVASMVFHIVRERETYDWAERIARSLFVYLQCALWSTIVAFIVIDNFTTIDFGGIK